MGVLQLGIRDEVMSSIIPPSLTRSSYGETLLSTHITERAAAAHTQYREIG
jgi:hypothetical protein